jgi:vacuolar-type H+-ATPase subunit D/Vma8
MKGLRVLRSSRMGRKKLYNERIIIPAVEGTIAAIDLAKGKLSRAEFIRRAIVKAVERELRTKLKPKDDA